MPTIDDRLEQLAKIGYEESIRRYGASPSGLHEWERQSDEARRHWAGVVKAVLHALAEMKAKAPAPPEMKKIALELLAAWAGNTNRLITATPATNEKRDEWRRQLDVDMDNYRARIEAAEPDVGPMGTFRGVRLVSVAELEAAMEADRAEPEAK